jgi:hypothetical protein
MIAALLILGVIFFAFCQFVLAPILTWVKKRQIKAGVHSFGMEADMHYQARLNAKALADELERRGLK